MNTLGWCQNKYFLRITNSDLRWESKNGIKTGICYELQRVTLTESRSLESKQVFAKNYKQRASPGVKIEAFDKG